MNLFDRTLCEVDSPFGHYQVVETVYRGRPARVLYSGQRAAAQSGIAMDGKPDMLFEYNQALLNLIKARQPSKILLIGGGAYTLPRAVSQLQPLPSLFTVVERDSALLELAEKYYYFATFPGFEVAHQDGRDFLNSRSEIYDLIIIDAFSDLSVPTSLITIEAMQAYRLHLTSNGILAMNVIASGRGRNAEIVHNLSAACRQTWPHFEVLMVESGFDEWQAQNLLVTAYDQGSAIGPDIHCATLNVDLSEVGSILHDA